MKLCDFWKRLTGKTTTTFSIVQGDITALGFQCVVNAANSNLYKGGGVCGSIYRAAGEELEWETDLMEPIAPGMAVITNGYKMSDHIIHAVGPIYNPDISLDYQNAILTNAYENSLDLANQYKIEDIAFPLISTGIYGYPRPEAVKVAIQAINTYIKNNPYTTLKTITICCFSEDDLNLCEEIKELL